MNGRCSECQHAPHGPGECRVTITDHGGIPCPCGLAHGYLREEIADAVDAAERMVIRLRGLLDETDREILDRLAGE